MSEPPFDPEYDKVTPLPITNLDAERAVLGALILSPELSEKLVTELEPGDFYRPNHETIWNAAHSVASDPDRPLDHLTLLDELTRRGELLRIGGAPYLLELMQACPIPGNATFYAGQVRDAARLRAVKTIATRLSQVADRADPTRIDLALTEALQTLDDAAARFGPRSTVTATGLRDLTWILTGAEPEQPQPSYSKRTDGHALFYAGQVNGIFGDPECGKTWLAQTAIVEALGAGGTAAMIDVDHNGPNHTSARLLLLGARLEHIADPNRFRYYEPEDADQLRAAALDVTAHHPDVVVIDSLGEIFPILGAKSNDSDEITLGMRAICIPPAAAGSCVITIDHLPKSTEARASGYAIGTTAKKRMIRGSYLRAEARAQPAPGQVGRITLRIEKDTLGQLRASSGGGYAGTLTLDSTQPHTTSWTIGRDEMPKNADGTFRPTTYMEKVATYVAENGGCTQNEIETGIPGTAKHIRSALQILLNEGHITRMPGPRRSWLHTLTIPYREAEDDQAQPTL